MHLAIGPKTIEHLRVQLNELTALLAETRAELTHHPSSVDLRCKAATLDTEIERRRLLLAALLNTQGVA